MSFLDFVTWAALACLPLFIIVDFAYKARRYDTPRFWRLRTIGCRLSFCQTLPTRRSLGSVGYVTAFTAIRPSTRNSRNRATAM